MFQYRNVEGVEELHKCIALAMDKGVEIKHMMMSRRAWDAIYRDLIRNCSLTKAILDEMCRKMIFGFRVYVTDDLDNDVDIALVTKW